MAQHMQKLTQKLRFGASQFLPAATDCIVADPCFATSEKQMSLVCQGVVCVASYHVSSCYNSHVYFTNN